jgi:hypothetical protein
MDVSSIIFLSLIVSAFILFAVALAYADYATRQARRTKADQAAEKALTLTAEPEKRAA